MISRSNRNSHIRRHCPRRHHRLRSGRLSISRRRRRSSISSNISYSISSSISSSRINGSNNDSN